MSVKSYQLGQSKMVDGRKSKQDTRVSTWSAYACVYVRVIILTNKI